MDHGRLRSVSVYVQPPATQPGGRMIQPGQANAELVTGGRGWFQDQARGWVEVVTGDQLWHEAGEWTIQRSDPIDPYRCLTLAIVRDPAEARPLPRHTRWSDPGASRSFAQEAMAWSRDDAIDPDSLSRAVVGRMILEGQRWLGRQRGEALPVALVRAQAHLDQAFAEDCPLEAIAVSAGCSPQHLHHLFRTHLGISPHQWLLARRIREAKERLAGGQDGLEHIATASGFLDAASLCRAFRRVVGVSPGAWRRNPW